MNDQQAIAHARLLLNSQVSDLDDCWSEGYEASLAALEELDNPYHAKSPEYLYWQEGWWAATCEEPSIFPITCPDQDHLNALIEQPTPKNTAFDFKTLVARSIQFSSVAVLAAVGLELADVAMANLGFFEVFAMV